MNQKGFINIIIIGIVVIIIATAGYFALTRKTAEAPAMSQESGVINRTQTEKTTNSNSQSLITVLSPNEGERWEIGQTYMIEWLLSQNFPNESFISISLLCNADLFLEGVNDDGCRGTTITNLPLNQTRFLWTIPYMGEQINNYLISVRVILGEKAIAGDTSDAPFSILEEGKAE